MSRRKNFKSTLKRDDTNARVSSLFSFVFFAENLKRIIIPEIFNIASKKCDHDKMVISDRLSRLFRRVLVITH